MLSISMRYFTSIISGRLHKITLSAAKQTPAESTSHLSATYYYLIQLPTLFTSSQYSFSITSEDFRLSVPKLLINILSASRPESNVWGRGQGYKQKH